MPYKVWTQGKAALAYTQKMSRRLSLGYKHFSKRQHVNAAASLAEKQLLATEDGDSNAHLVQLEIWALEKKQAAKVQLMFSYDVFGLLHMSNTD